MKNINRELAIKEYKLTYLGKPCHRCKSIEKYVINHSCKQCKNGFLAKKFLETNPESLKKSRQKYYKINKKKLSEYRKEHRKTLEGKLVERKSFIKRKYGITIEQYNELLELQNYVCYICKQKEESERYQQLSIDHSHKTGKIRKLLCGSCNKGLGCFKDDFNLLVKASDYLKEHNERNT